MSERTKVLLYSGGMDSWIMSRLWQPDVRLYVDIGGAYSAEEVARLPRDVEVEHLPLARWERDDKIIPLRNLYFVMVASYYGERVALGATAGDRVLDKSAYFAKRASDLLSYLYRPQHWTDGRKVSIELPFKHWTKTTLVREYRAKGWDLEEAWRESFSCYDPTPAGTPCWHCKPCFRKWVAFVNAGYHPDAITTAMVRSYILGEILPLINAGEYGREQEEKEIAEAMILTGGAK